MNLAHKIESLGQIEIMPRYAKLKDNNLNLNTYITENKLKLPQAYIDFSITYGFGQFTNDVVVKSLEKIPSSYSDGTIPISFIYGWGTEEDSLQCTRQSLLDQINDEYFVFAEGNPGDYLLINMPKGDIYYYSHDHCTTKNLFLIANSFEDFVNNLEINSNITDHDDLEEEWFSDDF